MTKTNRNQVNLNAHETHEQSQISAGVDLLKPPITSSEATALKDRRDRVIMEQQRNAIYANQPRHVHCFLLQPMAMQQPGYRAMRPITAQSPAFARIQNPMSPNFLGAQMRMAAQQQNFTPEQLQMYMARQVSARTATGQSQDSPPKYPLGLPQSQQRLHTDLSTAAAFVALSNAQQATKLSVMLVFTLAYKPGFESSEFLCIGASDGYYRATES